MSACTADGVKDAVTPDDPKDPIALTANVDQQATDVQVNTIVAVKAQHGSITSAVLASDDGKSTVKGRVAGDSWLASQRLEPGTAYTLQVRGKGEDGKAGPHHPSLHDPAADAGPADLPVRGAAAG